MRTQAGVDRLAELEPELMAEFGCRPILLSRDQFTTNSRSLTWAMVEHWLLQRGLVARIESIVGGQISFDRLTLISEAS